MAAVTDFDVCFKLLMVGCSGAGKSSLLSRFAEDVFDEELSTTIGVDFKVKYMKEAGKTVKLMIWDTAGQEKFKTLTSSYYRGAHGVVFVYDVTDASSFDRLDSWMEEVETFKSYPDMVKVLVGNKLDLIGSRKREVDEGMAREFARNHGMMWIEASAKTRQGVSQAFAEMVSKLLESESLVEVAVNSKRPTKDTVHLGAKKGNNRSGGSLCC
eukprot:TRINITY_DN826_c0_g1_i1.p1 TRINITY_DN826_c0_g1~~TRINITY_DN826_c0_g1_i1.p1  ORF type:complete len:213 (+),score=89.99 TRINITY_DN826_c0_g1_i1:113-751(+)